ncbi:hypothetical protein PAMP_006984 [Pampus punctatissimus]
MTSYWHSHKFGGGVLWSGSLVGDTEQAAAYKPVQLRPEGPPAAIWLQNNLMDMCMGTPEVFCHGYTCYTLTCYAMSSC